MLTLRHRAFEPSLFSIITDLEGVGSTASSEHSRRHSHGHSGRELFDSDGDLGELLDLLMGGDDITTRHSVG